MSRFSPEFLNQVRSKLRSKFPEIAEQQGRWETETVPRVPVQRSNSTSNHSASPGSFRLQHGLQNSGIGLRGAMIVSAVVADPQAALLAVEGLIADDTLSPAAKATVGQIINILGEMDQATSETLLAALRTAGIGASIDAALEEVHKAGITSLDPGAASTEARALLSKH